MPLPLRRLPVLASPPPCRLRHYAIYHAMITPEAAGQERQRPHFDAAITLMPLRFHAMLPAIFYAADAAYYFSLLLYQRHA